MKKIISLFLASILIMAFFAGCGKKAENKNESSKPTLEDVTDTGNENVSGGWTANTTFGEAQIPAEAKEAFDKAMTDFTGVAYTPVAYLGSQVVAGTNFAFLCTGTTMTATPETQLKVVTIYRDLENNAEVKDIKGIDIAIKEDAEIDYEPTEGGWNVTDAVGTDLGDEANKAFNAALEGMTGVAYKPIALLGTQVVAGTNYAVLCTATTVTAEPANALAVVYVYAGVQGENEILGINAFDF